MASQLGFEPRLQGFGDLLITIILLTYIWRRLLVSRQPCSGCNRVHICLCQVVTVWQSGLDSNRQPTESKSVALPLCYRSTVLVEEVGVEPTMFTFRNRFTVCRNTTVVAAPPKCLVSDARLELATSCSQSRRSTRLS